MTEKNDIKYITFCKELKMYVDEYHHFPNKHTSLLNQIKYIRRKIKQGTLEDWKKEMFLEIAAMRSMEEHTGGRRKKKTTSDNNE